MKQVLYLSYDGMTDPLGQSQVLPYLIRLSKHNIRFTLISFEKKERFERTKQTIQAICDAHHIDWKPCFYTKKPPVLSTVKDLRKMRRTALEEHNKKHFELVHCRSYISALVGLHFKRKLSVPFLFDMRGFWADERVDGGIWNLKNPVFKLVYTYFKKKERHFLSESDAIVSLTEHGKTEILSWQIPQVRPEKISVIPCAADFELFEEVNPEKRKQAKERLGINPNDPVVSYLGSLGTWYLADEMLLFFREFKSKFENSKFFILTGDDPELITKLLPKYDLKPDDLVITFAQRAELNSYLSASDVSLIFIKPAYSKISSSPTKMGELLAMGIPVICNDKVGDVSMILNQIEAGYCLPHFGLDEIQTCIHNMESILTLQPHAIREQAKTIFELGLNSEKYLEIYRKL